MDINEKKPKRPRIGESRIPGTGSADMSRNDNAPDISGDGAEKANQNRIQENGDFERQSYNRPYSNQGGYRRPGGYNNQGGYNRQRYYGGRQGGYNNYDNNNQGGYGHYDNMQNGNYRPRPNYRPNSDVQGENTDSVVGGENMSQQQDGGYTPRRQQGYTPRPFNNRTYINNRQQGGYNNSRPYGNRQYDNKQQDGYGNRPYNNNRQGGYNNQDGYGNRQYNNRQGGYNNRQQGNRHQGNRPFPRQGKSFTPRPKRVEYEMPAVDPDEQIRLNKFMANAGLCSRREADLFIQQGLVKVNGEVATELGTKISHSDVVEFNEKVVTLERKCYILLNKPKDCVTTSDDPNGRTTVMDIVKGACEERIYPVGRLDRNTTGVLLLTNDGDLASKLTHPKYVKKKIYHVWTDKDISEDDMQRIADGIELEDGPIHADAISYATETDRNQAGIEIHSGRNRIVRRIFESLGYHVTKLDRVYFAGLTKKNLPRGRWRYLTQEEVNFLKMGSFE